jgi:hypothetical protein
MGHFPAENLAWRGTARSLQQAESLQRQKRALDAVNAVLDADAFDGTAAEALASRWQYADAASCLVWIVDCPGHELVPSFLKSPALAPYRFGVAFGAVASEQDFMEPITLDDLHAMDTPEARLALIAAGGNSDWSSMDRRSRALFVLRHVVRAMMARTTQG